MSEITDGEPLLKKPQVAVYFGVTTRTIELWMRDGLIPYFKIGRNIRFRKADILEQLRDKNKIN